MSIADTGPAGAGADTFIGGNGIYLRGLSEEDLEGNWYRWFNDAEVTYYQDKGYFPNTREKQREYYRGIEASSSDVVLAIVETESGRHIGNVGLHHIEWIHRTAALGIVIGEKDAWGKGFGKEAWRLITEYGFETLNLHKITAAVLDGHDASLACAVASGFDLEGTQKEQMYRHGRYYNLILVGLTHSVWFQRGHAEGAQRPRPRRRSK